MTTKELQKRSERSQDLRVLKSNGNYFVESAGNSLVPFLFAGPRGVSLNCYTVQPGRLPYLQ